MEKTHDVQESHLEHAHPDSPAMEKSEIHAETTHAAAERGHAATDKYEFLFLSKLSADLLKIWKCLNSIRPKSRSKTTIENRSDDCSYCVSSLPVLLH